MLYYIIYNDSKFLFLPNGEGGHFIRYAIAASRYHNNILYAEVIITEHGHMGF